MSDGAEFIFNAIKKAFGITVIHLVCYFHLKQAVKRQLAGHGMDKVDRAYILRHIDNMHRLMSKTQFV